MNNYTMTNQELQEAIDKTQSMRMTVASGTEANKDLLITYEISA